jgi:hypothetical protein
MPGIVGPLGAAVALAERVQGVDIVSWQAIRCVAAGSAGQPEGVCYRQRPVRPKKYALNAETADRPGPHRPRFTEITSPAAS